jgi:hypothetical protein
VIDHCQLSSNAFHAIHCIHSSPIVTNSSIVSNEHFGFSCSSSFPIVVNSIIYGNSGDFIYDWLEVIPSNPVVSYSLVQDHSPTARVTYVGDNIFNQEPRFVDPDNGNYYLLDSSPCIDSATDYFVWNQNVIVDLDENEYFGDAPDMGAYEWQGVGIEELHISSIPEISNYPNPFNPTTTISFSLADEGDVELTVYNMKGQKVKTLLHQDLTRGYHSIVWNGDDAQGKLVSSGIYYYQLMINGVMKTVNRCVLLK